MNETGVPIAAECPRCDETSDLTCSNCGHAARFTLSGEGARCYCEHLTTSLACKCGATIDKKFFTAPIELASASRGQPSWLVQMSAARTALREPSVPAAERSRHDIYVASPATAGQPSASPAAQRPRATAPPALRNAVGSLVGLLVTAVVIWFVYQRYFVHPIPTFEIGGNARSAVSFRDWEGHENGWEGKMTFNGAISVGGIHYTAFDSQGTKLDDGTVMMPSQLEPGQSGVVTIVTIHARDTKRVVLDVQLP